MTNRTIKITGCSIEQANKMAKEAEWLGEIIEVLVVNEYGFVVYHPHLTEGCTVTKKVDYDSKRYNAWLNGKSTSTSYLNFDSAMAGLIAEKHEGPNHRADKYFMKMIKD